MAIVRREIAILDSVQSASDSETILLDSTQYSNSVSFYFEIVASVTAGTATITLRRKGTTTDDATLSVSNTTPARQRTAAFTPPGAAQEYVVHMAGGTSPVCRAAKIIIIQNGSITASEEQVQLGIGSATTTSTTLLGLTRFWNYTASNWDGSPQFLFEAVLQNDSTKGTMTAQLQEDDGNFANWTDVTNGAVTSSATVPTRVRAGSAFTPTNGRNYRIAIKSSSTKYTAFLYNAQIIIRQSNGGGITKWEGQYFLTGQGSISTTGLRDYDSYYDPAEWNGATINYYHEISAPSSGTNTAKLQIDPNGSPSDITNSSVTGTNRARSSALSMPGSAQTFDVNLTAGIIHSSVVIAVVFISGSALTINVADDLNAAF